MNRVCQVRLQIALVITAGFVGMGATGCSSTAASPTPTSESVRTAPVDASSSTPCAADELEVAVRFAKAVLAHDVAAYSACESATAKPSTDTIATLAKSGPLLFDRASPRNGGNSVDIPEPEIPNGDLPPHICGVTINGQFESGGWFVTDVALYCSS